MRGSKSTAHAHTVWEDADGHIFIQSIYLGNTTEWIGRTYGEEGAIAAFKADYSDFNLARKMFVEKFPAVEKRLSRYESILADISSKHHVVLHLRCSGEMGVATFYATAKIEAKNLTAGEKVEIMRLNVEALKEAWSEIAKYERSKEQKENR